MIPAITITKRNTNQDAKGKTSLPATFLCGRRGVRLTVWSLAILSVTGSVGYGQGKQSVTVEIAPSQAENQSGPNLSEIAKIVLKSLNADASLLMANFRSSADEALSEGPQKRQIAFTLIQIASPSEITSYSSQNNRITLSPVADFNAFCNAIDYAQILEKNRSRRYVKIRIKRDELMKENLVKRAEQAGRKELTDQLYDGKKGGRFSGFSFRDSGFDGSSSDDEPGFEDGEAVEVEIGSDRYQGVVVKKAKDSAYVVSLTDMKAVAKGLRDRKMRRVVTQLDSLPIVAPSDYLRLSRRSLAPALIARVWKDKSGRFKVEATYVSQTEDAVKIQKQDGSIVAVPLAKLSQEDRDYLTGLSVQTASSEAGVVRPIYAKELSIDRSSVRLIRLSDVQPGTLPVVVPVEPGDFSTVAKTIAINNSKDAHDRFNGLTRLETAINGSKGIAHWNASLHSRLPQQLLAFDATKNEAQSLIRLPKSQHVFDIDPNRGLVITGEKRDAFIQAKQLTISRVGGNTIRPILEWAPYRGATIDGEVLHTTEVESAWFLSGSRVLTKSRVGRLWTIWRLTKQKAIAEFDFITDHVEFSDAWIRRDGKVAAISTREKISLLDISKGLVTRQIPVHGGRYDQLQYSEDGHRLVAARRGECRTWDLNNGEIDQECWHPAFSHINRIDWVDDNLLLVNGEYLFDMKHSVLLWEYRGGRYGTAFDNGKLWSIEEGSGIGPNQMIAATIPHHEARHFMDRLENNATLTIARAGDQVGLEVSIPDSHADPAEVISIVSDRLRAAGYKLVDDQNPSLMMVVTAKPEKVEKVEVYEKGEWHLYGKDPSIRNFIPHLWSCELQLDGETIWRQAVTWGSGVVIQMKLNDSPDAAVARAQKAQVARVIPTRIPNKVARPGTATKNGAYGFSKVTAEDP